MTYEEWHAFVATHLAEPVLEETAGDREVWFTSGEPGEVIVRVRHSTITVFEYAERRRGASLVVRPIRVGGLRAAGVDDNRAMNIVQGLIGAARERRLGRYVECGVCRRREPPERARHQVCPECAQDMSGSVH
jgi:hypothetical protein